MRTMPKIRHSLTIVIVIILVDLAINILLPGLVAYKDRVFYLEEVEAKFPKHSTRAAESYRSYKQKRDEYIQLLANADLQVGKILQGGGNYAELDELLKLRDTYREELSILKNPIIVSPFYGNR